ncbi:hypothetical protein SAMN04488515_1795 [Cognatiyoonia koreensis]|uniref:Uncharacterized protein n=1 Tax=Cognatiyoonia koreensis TaxID=364200 RepID=A0A1I0QBP6_9RHOB|nr:hypothetical protein [Cognatiyoonia koreensis]SEW24272.1 hypothetical protein SAMN04488515_1795 [Cognatiyoonia koreensis]
MKKILLLIGTLVVIGLGWFGYWIYDIVQNGVRQYTIAGETVGLAGYEAKASTGAPNTAVATFTERLMPFTRDTFPFEDACSVLAQDPPSLPVIGIISADIITVVASGDDGSVAKTYDVTNGTCTERGT